MRLSGAVLNEIKGGGGRSALANINAELFVQVIIQDGKAVLSGEILMRLFFQ